MWCTLLSAELGLNWQTQMTDPAVPTAVWGCVEQLPWEGLWEKAGSLWEEAGVGQGDSQAAPRWGPRNSWPGWSNKRALGLM